MGTAISDDVSGAFFNDLFSFLYISTVWYRRAFVCSRSYQSFHSVIGYWHQNVIIMSSVRLCIIVFMVGVEGLKLYRRVSSRQFPIHLFRHFCRRMYRLVTKHTERRTDDNSASERYRRMRCKHRLRHLSVSVWRSARALKSRPHWRLQSPVWIGLKWAVWSWLQN